MTQAVDETTATEPETALEPEAAVTAETNTGETGQATEAQDDGDEGELIVSIGEDTPPQDETQSAPQWVRDLRKADREKSKRIKELEQRLAEKEQPAQTALPAKPTLEGCDYDADKFERDLAGWYDAKRKHDEAEAVKRQAQEQAEADWQARVQAYEASKAKLPTDMVEAAEHTAREIFNEVQWAILLDGSDNAALLITALGRNPAKAKELASVKSLSQFAFRAAKIEAEIKTMKRKASTPAPEGAITGTAPGAIGGADATLERLRAKAMQTGDMTEVIRYKQKLRAAAN